MDISNHIYGLAPSWAMAFLCWLVMVANIYQSHMPLYIRKRPQKRVRAFVWWLIGVVYFYDHITTPLLGETKILFRVAMGILVLSELAYHFDTLLNVVEVITLKAKRKVRDGPTDDR